MVPPSRGRSWVRSREPPAIRRSVPDVWKALGPLTRSGAGHAPRILRSPRPKVSHVPDTRQEITRPGRMDVPLPGSGHREEQVPGSVRHPQDPRRGGRIPLTIADADPSEGTITLIVQSVGKSTLQLSSMEVGESIPDITGPLGMPTRIERRGCVLCVGGGIGTAPLYPVARGMKEVGNRVVSILGARSANLLILEEEMRSVSDRVVTTTDDGSAECTGWSPMRSGCS